MEARVAAFLADAREFVDRLRVSERLREGRVEPGDGAHDAEAVGTEDTHAALTCPLDHLALHEGLLFEGSRSLEGYAGPGSFSCAWYGSMNWRRRTDTGR